MMGCLVILFLASVIICNSNANKLPHHQAIESKCQWNITSNTPEVYFINLDKSIDRRHNIEQHLNEVGYKYRRIAGITPNQLYIPNDIETTWRTAWCKTQTNEVIPTKHEVNSDIHSPLRNYTYIMSAMCGRGKNRNTPKELGCTTSHIYAMWSAIYQNTTNNRYALIIEDDVSFPFNLDFSALVSSAPKDFGILQLFNSNKETMKDTYFHYTKNTNFLWAETKNLKYWSTCAYLIDREVLKPVIDKIFYQQDGWWNFKVIAGIQGPCSPAECCVDKKFISNPPCVWASAGYQADSFLYAMTKTYITTVPLITNGKGVDTSTFHQDHVEMFHKASFRKQRQIINEMLSGNTPPPPYAKPACNYIDENVH